MLGGGLDGKLQNSCFDSRHMKRRRQAHNTRLFRCHFWCHLVCRERYVNCILREMVIT
jgi:hypothetical protein